MAHDELPTPIPPNMPSADAFAGKPIHPTEMDGGKAQEIKKLAIKTRGEYELHYIPRESPAAWAAGHTYNEILDITRNDHAKAKQLTDNGPYFTDNPDPMQGRYLGTPEQWANLEKEFEWVELFWLGAVGPEPAGFDDAIRELDAAAKALFDKTDGTSLSEPAWQDANGAIGTWQSDAAETFKSRIWHPLPNIVKRQASVATAMAHSLDAERSTWVAHRFALQDIADKTIAALHAVKVKAPNNSKAAFSIVAGIVALAATPFTAGSSAAAAVAALGAANTIWSGAKDMKKPERADVPMGAATVQEVLSNMKSAVEKAGSEVETNENNIANSLRAFHARITDTATSESVGTDPGPGKPPEHPPGFYGEATETPRQKFVISRPTIVDSTASLPAPNIPTLQPLILRRVRRLGSRRGPSPIEKTSESLR